MPTVCRFVKVFPGWEKVQPGDMWYYGEEEWSAGREALEQVFKDLAPEYFQENFTKRPPLTVLLPNGDPFRIDCVASASRNGWHVSGDVPLITVHPSINLVGHYHGWLQNGILSDDVEGRTFSF